MFCLKTISALLLCCLISASVHAQVASLKLSNESIALHEVATANISGSAGERIDFSTVPQIKNIIRDTGGNLFYLYPDKEGQYLVIVTVFDGEKWDHSFAVLTVGTKKPPPVEPPKDDLYGLIKASGENLPKDTTATSRAAMRQWYNDFAKQVVSEDMSKKQILAALSVASKKPPWNNGWRLHYNSLRSKMTNQVLPKQWATAYRDIAKGIPQ